MISSTQDSADSIDVSIILISWNSLDLTAAALSTLQEHTAGVVYEVLVIDNGTTKDAGVSELPRRFPWITMITNPANLGFTKANNQGIQQARGRYVLLLNSDTEQTENAIGRAVEYMDANSEVGILGVMHRNGDLDRSYQASFAAFPTPARSCSRLLFGKMLAQVPAAVPPPERDVDWVTGSFLLIRRDCLDQIGGLDERFFAYSEDIDLCFQARKAGWRVRFWPGVSLVHFGSSSATQVADKTFMIYRNELEFFRKNHPPLVTFAYYVVMIARLALSTLYQLARWLIGRSRWADVRVRWDRQWSFMTLRSDQWGLTKS